MSCPCNLQTCSEQLSIVAGLTNIPRQIATFNDFRKWMLALIPGKYPLAKWHGRDIDDLGIMIIEMWAYVSDILAFYDEVIAHETYIRTARRRPSLRKLTGLLGYIPTPPVAAFVKLALTAEGRKPVSIPAGIAFRSGAFDTEAPQVFELDNDGVIHPFTNKWDINTIRPSKIGTTDTSSLYVDSKTNKLKPGDIVLVKLAEKHPRSNVCIVSQVTDIKENNNERITRIDFDRNTALRQYNSISELSLLVPQQRASLWQMNRIAPDPYPLTPSNNATQIILDSLYRNIKPGQHIILQRDNEYRWCKVKQVTEVMQAVTPGQATEMTGDVTATVTPPPVRIPVTKLILNRGINYTGDTWDNDDVSKIIVHYSLSERAKAITRAKSVIDKKDINLMELKGVMEAPPDKNRPNLFLLEDKNKDGLEVTGSVNFETGAFTPDNAAQWTGTLTPPVHVFGNIISATRGESVRGEILGSGDASLANQSFVLKKKPLTYLTSPTAENEAGIVSTLQLYVNNILWKEVPTFFNISSDARVYIIRRNDKGESIITFGDGINGSRLPSGTDNVMADYRFGAGAASPPSGSITQLAKPVKGIKTVVNPVAAAGGDDEESGENIRINAPGSALILGRAVSIIDMEAVAARVPGVRAVQVEWRWNEIKQRPVIQLWYIGEQSIRKKILQRLRALSDPSVPFSVEYSRGIKIDLAIDLEIDTRFIPETVKTGVHTILCNKVDGILIPEKTGIGRPLFRSHIFSTVLSVPGVTAVRGITWKGNPMTTFAKRARAGRYFDFENGTVTITAGEEING